MGKDSKRVDMCRSIPDSLSPWSGAWQSTPGFLPGESHGQRSLVGYSPRGHKEIDTTSQLNDNNKEIKLYQKITNSSVKNKR